MPKAIGIVKIKIDGKLINSKPGASINVGGPSRAAVEADQPGFFSESTKPSKIECDLIVDKDFSADELRRLEDFTATFEADTGQIYVINHAYVVDPPDVAGGTNGGSKIIIEGPPAQEMK